MLIAIAIFTVLMITVSNSYINIARAQREANAIRGIYSELRYVFNLIGEEARSKTIDYGCPRHIVLNEDDFLRPIDPGATSNVCNDLLIAPEGTYLALINREATQRTIFNIEDDVLSFYKESKGAEDKAWQTDPGFENGFVEIELKGIDLNAMKFDIAPLADPFDPENIGCGIVQFQPSVTVYANISAENKGISDFTLDLQTSFSSRVYNQQTNNL